MIKLRNVFKHIGVISSSDVDIVASDRKTKELYEEAATTGKAPGKTCKIQILGDERAGKTSLRKRLMGERFDPEEPPTFGIDTRFCKVNEVDESWRERKGETGNEYDRVISWVLANALRTWNNSSESQITSEPNHSWLPAKLLKVIISSISLFALVSVILINFALSSLMTAPTFCYILILGSALSVFVTNKSDIYRVGVGVAIFVPTADVLLGVLFEHFTNTETEIHREQNGVNTSFVILWLLFGTVFGFVCGFGLRTGVAAGALTLITPTIDVHQQENSTAYHEIVKVFFGLGCGLNFIFWCSSLIPPLVQKVFCNHACNPKRMNILNNLAFASLLLFLLPCIKYANDAPLCFHGFLLGVGIMSGLFFGRWLTNNYFAHDKYIEKLLVGFVVGVGAGYIAGYNIPLFHEDCLSMINGIVRLMPLAAAEIFRRLVNKKHPAHVRMVSEKLFTSTYTIPVKLSLWDFAGQEFYYNTHHTFMAPDAVYVIVFDLYKFKQESLRSKEFARIKFWMSSVHQHANSPIFLVGTHLDCVEREDLEHISHYLDDYLLAHNYPFLHKLVLNENFPFFAIDNSGTMNNYKSSGLHDDTTLLRDMVRKETEKAKTMKLEYPIRWRRFLDLIQLQHKSSSGSSTHNEPFISLSDLKTDLNAFDFSDVEEIREMLEFFHESGEILYDSVDSILRQFIILQPQFIVDVMESIVDIPESKTLGRLSRAGSRLRNTGVLEYDLAKFLVTRKVQIAKESNLSLVLAMLEAKDLLCKVYHSEPDVANGFDGERKLLYVVPSMLPKGQPIPSVSVDWDVQYYLDFGPLLPEAVLFRLMARCSFHSNLFCQGKNQCVLFREGGLFSLGTQFFFMLQKQQPCPDQGIIEVSVKATPESNPIDVLRYLHNIMETLRCRDFPCLPYHVGIRCPHSAPHQGCTSSDMWHIIPLCGSGDTMFPEECQVHRLCNGRLVDLNIDASIPASHGTLDEEPMVVNIMGNNNVVVIAGRNARVLIHRGIVASTDSNTGNSYNIIQDSNDIDVFISCSHRDEGWVQENLVRLLSSPPHHLTVCTNQYDTPTHSNHILNMKEIKASHVFLVVCSKNYLKDPTGRLRYEREVARICKIPMVAVGVDGANGPEDMFDEDIISFSDSNEIGLDSLLSKVLVLLENSC